MAADGTIDFDDGSRTENTRVSYPIYHIDNIVKPVSKAGHATKVIFLTADAFGVLPPVAKLTKEQTKYHFLSGFTAKLAGTERGITEPTPTFSSCFGAAFLSLHPTKYGQELVKRMEAAGAEAYLVNTGWNGTGKRISIKDTRGIIDAIWMVPSRRRRPRYCRCSTWKCRPSCRASTPPSWIRETLTPTRPSGMPRRPIWPGASSRTSSASPTTTKANAWSRRARSCKKRASRSQSRTGQPCWPVFFGRCAAYGSRQALP